MKQSSIGREQTPNGSRQRRPTFPMFAIDTCTRPNGGMNWQPGPSEQPQERHSEPAGSCLAGLSHPEHPNKNGRHDAGLVLGEDA